MTEVETKIATKPQNGNPLMCEFGKQDEVLDSFSLNCCNPSLKVKPSIIIKR